jgi:hypothetical protein
MQGFSLFHFNGRINLVKSRRKPLKYVRVWEVDRRKTPVHPKQRGAGWVALLATVRQDVEKGISKDWGVFVDQTNGYAVAK